MPPNMPTSSEASTIHRNPDAQQIALPFVHEGIHCFCPALEGILNPVVGAFHLRDNAAMRIRQRAQGGR